MQGLHACLETFPGVSWNLFGAADAYCGYHPPLLHNMHLISTSVEGPREVATVPLLRWGPPSDIEGENTRERSEWCFKGSQYEQIAAAEGFLLHAVMLRRN